MNPRAAMDEPARSLMKTDRRIKWLGPFIHGKKNWTQTYRKSWRQCSYRMRVSGPFEKHPTVIGLEKAPRNFLPATVTSFLRRSGVKTAISIQRRILLPWRSFLERVCLARSSPPRALPGVLLATLVSERLWTQQHITNTRRAWKPWLLRMKTGGEYCVKCC